ncbi:MAG: tetratricopeptide repeat protein [Rubrivivax sp.]|nr:tetratricopeptide repeat protein [Rubrivivax sp.]
MRRAEPTLVALAVVALSALIAGCSSRTTTVPDDEPTLASLKARQATVATTARAPVPPAQAIAAWQAFLASPTLGPRAPERVEAERRLADLEMDRADAASAQSGQPPDLRVAIQRYQSFLKQHPQAAGLDGVLYQLARAQDLNAEPAAALTTLDRLVAQHPGTPVLAEVQFRRGELLFTAGRHADAEQAFAVVLQAQPESLFHERSLYMQGWSRFKQAKLDDALQSFFAVLDRKLGANEPGAVPALSRADRELLEDSFRVVSLSLQNLQGAASIPALVNSAARESYEPQVYRELAELYLKQERVKDAADTLAAFAARRPLHAQAPVLLARVITIQERAGFTTLALQSKQDFVSRYGVRSAFRAANASGWEQAQPLVKTHLAELARHHHALAQKSRAEADVAAAIRWYREAVESFPDAPEATESRFLLAELLFENQRWAEAAAEYETVAYADKTSPRSAEAGYAVLLAHAKLEPAGDKAAWQRQGVDRALRFADRYPADARAPAVLADATDKRFALGDSEGAVELARRLLALQPEAAPEQRRVAWTVLAHTAFEAGRFADAEAAYRALQPLAQNPDSVNERLAASIYKQGEADRAAGRTQAALGHFDRVPASSARATAEIDAAAARVALGDWAGAATALEDFRRRYPTNPLTADVPARLAAAYLELKQWDRAAAELARVADTLPDPAAARDARWQVATLQARAGDRPAEQRALETYLARHPEPLAPAIEARHRLAEMARQRGDERSALAWTRALMEAERAGGEQRTDRTRTLGALALLELSQPTLANYRAVALKEPLKRSLQLKQARLEQALAALKQVGDYGVPEAVTAANFHSAELYRDFGRALMASERPKGLKKAEREQYDVLLEEQAFPFEEKAIALHEANAQRATQSPHDPWTRRSVQALAQLVPARWAKAAAELQP